MAEQRQPFRFRLPWLAAPQPQPAPAPRPTSPAQAEAQPDRVPDASQPRTPGQTQRPPFRPAGVAPLARAEPPPSPSRATSQTHGPPPSPNRPASRVSPPPQEAPRASPPRPSQPAPKSQVSPKKETKISQQPRDEPIKPEETQPSPSPSPSPSPPSPKPRQVEVMTPPPPPTEKVVESLAEEKKLPEASREVAKGDSSPKQETKKQEPIKVEQPTQIPKGTKPDEIKQKPVVLDKKEVKGHEKETRAAHRPALREKKEDSPKFVQKHENPNSIITLSGENTGASMHLSSSDSSSKKERPIHIHRGYKTDPYGSDPNTTIDGVEGSKKSRDLKEVPEEEATKNIYVNNNVQGINNSLVFNSSLSQRNPGVHLALSLSRPNPVEPVVKSGAEEKGTVDARKSEAPITPTETVAYAPKIRRRCLRGLFLDSSDSEPDNPEKPRRHGCRVGCNQKSKDGKIDDL